MNSKFLKCVATFLFACLLHVTNPQLAAAQCKSSTNVDANCYTAPYPENQHSRYGWQLLEAKNYRAAVDAYTKAIALHPNNPSHYNNRAQALKGIGELKKAIEDYTAAIALDPRDDLYYSNRASAFLDSQEFKLAKADLEKALSINPKSWKARGHLARLNGDLGDYQAALELLNSLIADTPKSNEAHELRVVTYRNMGKLSEALADLKCETSGPEFRARCFGLRAQVHQLMGDTDRATADVAATLRLDAKSGIAYHVRAELKQKQGDDLGAVLDYTKALDIFGAYTLALLRRGDVLVRMGREEDALKDYDRAAAIDKRNVREIAFRDEARGKAEKIRDAFLAQVVKSPLMIFFDYGLTDLVNSAQPMIDIASRVLMKGHAQAIHVTGHADVVERAENPEIPTARAYAIRSALIRAGVPAEKVKASAGTVKEVLVPDVKGEKEPQNRRVVLTFTQ